MKDSDVRPFVVLDAAPGIKEELKSLTPEKLLNENDHHVWSKGTFVDCFTETQVIKAMKRIYDETFKIDSDMLTNLRKSAKKDTEQILEQYLYENKLGPLNKPDLGEALAAVIEDEIHGSTDRRKTEPEGFIENTCKNLNDDANLPFWTD